MAAARRPFPATRVGARIRVMLILALDTTTRSGSAALVRGDRLLEQREGNPSEPHARRLPGTLIELVEHHGFALTDIDLFAVAAGPGSFTGLRIGIATMQGLAFGTSRPLVGVSALEALACAAAPSRGDGAHTLGVWMDAQRDEVFSAAYRVVVEAGRAAPPTILDGPVAAPPAHVLRRWRTDGTLSRLVAVGDGAIRYAPIIRTDGEGLVVEVIEQPMAIASAVADFGRMAHAGGGVHVPHAIRPLYVRRSDAELARDRRRSQA